MLMCKGSDDGHQQRMNSLNFSISAAGFFWYSQTGCHYHVRGIVSQKLLLYKSVLNLARYLVHVMMLNVFVSSKEVILRH